jgi:hypothetical protein
VFAIPSVTEQHLCQRHSSSHTDEKATQEQCDKSMEFDPQDQKKDNCHASYGSGDESWLVDETTQPAFLLT